MKGFDRDAHFAELNRLFELPLQGLRTVVEVRRTLDGLEQLLIERARWNRSSWEEIGGALGISRQAAYSRHRPSVNPTDGV